jgi:hypothetical protein
VGVSTAGTDALFFAVPVDVNRLVPGLTGELNPFALLDVSVDRYSLPDHSLFVSV